MNSLSEVSQRVLEHAGWFSSRQIDTHLWQQMLEQAGYPVFDAALTVLERFGGLSITTEIFQQKPFYIQDGSQKVVLQPRRDPLLAFLPEKARALSQVSVWQALRYLEVNNLSIAPIGTYSNHYLYSFSEYSLFVLSNGQICAGKQYSLQDSGINTCGIFFLGDSVDGTINNVFQHLLAYW